MPASKSGTKMTEENISLEKSSQSAFTKAVKTIQKKIKNLEVELPSDTEQDNVQSGKKGKAIKRKVPKPTDRGVVYLRHIPHGFYEEPMKAYFSQFGQVTGIKLIRSQKTGNSRGFAFVEFLHTEVAKIVAETMNNYLMFDRLIKAEYVPPEKQKRIAFSRGLNTAVITPETCLRAKNRARYIRHRNKVSGDADKDAKERQTVLKRLAQLKTKLEKEGIAFQFEPVDVPPAVSSAAVAESLEDDTGAPVLELDMSDSEIEFNVPPGTLVMPLKRTAKKKKLNNSSANTPATKAKGTPMPAKKGKSIPTLAKTANGTAMTSKSKKCTPAKKGMLKQAGVMNEKASPDNVTKTFKKTGKEKEKQAAVALFHQRRANTRFGFVLKSNPSVPGQVIKKTKRAATLNKKAKVDGDEKTSLLPILKRSAGIQLRKNLTPVSPKAVAKKVILMHGVKMTPRKAPKK